METIKSIITIADKQYTSNKEKIRAIFKNSGFKISFINESINGRFRKGYYKLKVTHNFNSFCDKLKASRIIKEELDKLEVI